MITHLVARRRWYDLGRRMTCRWPERASLDYRSDRLAFVPALFAPVETEQLEAEIR